ncbi:MAG TPA: ABC transporter ATP-binding protein [Desulfatiglandales bacterium]|nr:ABC transporter ATP-binding protein [Desulfatiglandales bacterium]
MALLEIRSLSKYFGGLAAVSELDMDVSESEILGLIGPNGAGKTSVFNLISGFFPVTRGEVRFKGEAINHLKPHERAKRGIGRTFQQSVLFMGSSVFENVFTGFHMSYKTGLLQQFLHTGAARQEESAVKLETLEILDFMGMAHLNEEVAANLSHGHQRILSICVALASNPRLLLLDEPVTGMNRAETSNTIELIRQLRERGRTIVLVEHDMKAVMGLCDRIVVLNYGKKIAEGLPDEIKKNKEVIGAYLGKEGA